MTRAVQCGVIRLRGFDIFARGDARHAVPGAEGVTQFPAVVSFVTSHRNVLGIFQKAWSHGDVTGVAGCDFHGCGEPAQDIHHHMDFRVEASARLANSLMLRSSGAVGVLVDFAVGAVDKHRFGGVANDHQVLKILKIAVFGQAVEILVNGLPRAKLRRQGAPDASVAQEIPERVKVPVEVGRAAECDYKVVVSGLEFLDLIFLAAHGAEPA